MKTDMVKDQATSTTQHLNIVLFQSYILYNEDLTLNFTFAISLWRHLILFVKQKLSSLIYYLPNLTELTSKIFLNCKIQLKIFKFDKSILTLLFLPPWTLLPISKKRTFDLVSVLSQFTTLLPQPGSGHFTLKRSLKLKDFIVLETFCTSQFTVINYSV